MLKRAVSLLNAAPRRWRVFACVQQAKEKADTEVKKDDKLKGKPRASRSPLTSGRQCDRRRLLPLLPCKQLRANRQAQDIALRALQRCQCQLQGRRKQMLNWTTLVAKDRWYRELAEQQQKKAAAIDEEENEEKKVYQDFKEAFIRAKADGILDAHKYDDGNWYADLGRGFLQLK